MSIAELISGFERLEKPIGDLERNELLSTLQHIPLEVAETPASINNNVTIYFHSVQDVRLVQFILETEKYVAGKGGTHSEVDDDIIYAQACFNRDLMLYLKLLPEKEETIHACLRVALKSGTSTYWHKDKEFIQKFHDLYERLDMLLFHPKQK